MIQIVSLSGLRRLPRFLAEKVLIRLAITRLYIRKLFFNFRVALGEFRIVVIRAHQLCLKRGYFTRYECDLTSKFWYRCALSNHPVQCVNVFLECYHNRNAFLPDDQHQRWEPAATERRMQTELNG